MEENLNILSDEEINKELQDLPGWSYNNNKITKQLEFDSFSDGVSLLSQLAPFCDEIDHHPDVNINYKKIVFSLTRYSVGGKVTDCDFVVARQIERLYKDIYKK